MTDLNIDPEGSRKRQHSPPGDETDMPNEMKKVKTDEVQETRKAKRVHFNEQVERKIIGRAPKPSRRGKTTEDELYKANAKAVDFDDEGREVIGKLNNHTLDSDEEDEKDHDILDVRQLSGQEDRTVDFEGDTKITPFNMDDDLEEGHFDKSGNFIFDKKTEDLKDPWYDSVDWNKVETTEDKDDEMDVPEEEELEQDTMVNRLPVYQTIVEYLKDGETANDAMKRLNKSRVPIQEERKLRFAAKKAGQPYVDPVAEQIEKITASADLLIKKGDTTVYEMTKEHIQKVIDEAQKPDQDANEEEDDAEIFWEYKLANEDDSVLKKASTKEMMELTENGQLPADALVRRCGTEEFYKAGRVDFEIYLD
uniref:CD2 antigen cytoplasmic tail-binding protein 2 n=1 Tax=Panagrolaimus superbus TaxID=310955 RepID=A0A914Y6A6_9BILA